MSADGRVLPADDTPLARFAFATVRETAQCLAMHPNSVLRLIRDRAIPARKVRERWYVPCSYFRELEAEAYARTQRDA